MQQKNYRIISGSALKLIALLTMILDHTALYLFTQMPKMNTALFHIGDFGVTAYWLCRQIGRTAFPIYCFLIAEGFRHTHDRRKYGISLLVFAWLSELPWNLAHTGTLRYEKQNVFFTLFLGFCCIAVYEKYREDRKVMLLWYLALVFAVWLLNADYGMRGMIVILLLYLLREERILQGAVGCCVLNEGIATLPAFLLTGLYSGGRGFIRGRVLKYLFYIAYPLHLLILFFLRRGLFGYSL